jgi:hypothetical protein
LAGIHLRDKKKEKVGTEKEELIKREGFLSFTFTFFVEKDRIVSLRD